MKSIKLFHNLAKIATLLCLMLLINSVVCTQTELLVDAESMNIGVLSQRIASGAQPSHNYGLPILCRDFRRYCSGEQEKPLTNPKLSHLAHAICAFYYPATPQFSVGMCCRSDSLVPLHNRTGVLISVAIAAPPAVAAQNSFTDNAEFS